MFKTKQKNISFFSSITIHSLLLFLFYSIALHDGSISNGPIQLGFAPGAGGGDVGLIENEEKIINDALPKEDLIKEKKSETQKEIVGDKKNTASTQGNPSGGTGTGGSGIGNGSKSGLSLGLLAPPPKPKEEIYLIAVDEMPEPIGGIEKITSKIIYSPEAKRKGISGTVFVLAYIDENGSVRKTLLTKGIGNGCDEAAMNAVASTRFRPGKDKGRYVKVQVQIPVPISIP